MKKFKFIAVILFFVVCVMNVYAKAKIAECPNEKAKIVNSNSKIKKIEVQFYCFDSSSIKNNIYFELLGYDDKSAKWDSLSVFLLKNTFEFDLPDKKIKTVALAPNKNCVDFEIDYEKNGDTIKIKITQATVIENTEEKLICKNAFHMAKIASTTVFCMKEHTAWTEHQICVFYDDFVILTFENGEDISKLKTTVYEKGKDLIFSCENSNSEAYLFLDNQLIASGKELAFVGYENGDIYYTKEGFIYKNQEKLYVAASDFPVFFVNGNLYYVIHDDYQHKTILKNDEPITILDEGVSIYGLKTYTVSSKEEISILTLNKDGSVTIYKNGFPYATVTGNSILLRPTYSPDGNKFYYIEGRPRNHNYYAYYLHGDFPVPPTQGFTIIGEFKFSPDSKYIAVQVEDLAGKNWYIVSGEILGQFDGISDNYHFSEDSKTFFYRYYDSKTSEWIDTELPLK